MREFNWLLWLVGIQLKRHIEVFNLLDFMTIFAAASKPFFGPQVFLDTYFLDSIFR